MVRMKTFFEFSMKAIVTVVKDATEEGLGTIKPTKDLTHLTAHHPDPAAGGSDPRPLPLTYRDILVKSCGEIFAVIDDKVWV